MPVKVTAGFLQLNLKIEHLAAKKTLNSMSDFRRLPFTKSQQP